VGVCFAAGALAGVAGFAAVAPCFFWSRACCFWKIASPSIAASNALA